MMTSGVVGELAPAHKEYAELIHQSGLHLIDVVSMLLDMSRIEAGKFELQTESFEPEGLVEPCLQMVDAMAREREIKVATESGAKCCRNWSPTSAPAARSSSISLSNAIKFSHRGRRR